MGLFTRIKNMIVAPKAEWSVIASEEPNLVTVFFGYAFVLILASAVAGFIGYTFLWHDASLESSWREGVNETAALTWGLFFGIQTVLISSLGVWLSVLVINTLAKNFDSEKNMGRAMQLVAYAMTPVWLGGLLTIYPPIRIVGMLFALYGLYLLYLGLPPVMKTPKEKSLLFTIITVIILLAVNIVLVYLYKMFLWDMIFDTLRSIEFNAHPLK